MGPALFDVNALIALLDSNHVFHERIHAWWATHQGGGWASCPLTENGVLRVMSQPAYSPSVRFSVVSLMESFATFQRSTRHQFWSDSLSLLDEEHFQRGLVVSHRQLTDVYLLGLSVANQGCLVSFDEGIPLGAVKGARPEHLVRP